jgi:hypothetical protein
MKIFHVYVSEGQQTAYEVKADSKIDAINYVRTMLADERGSELEVVDRVPLFGFELEEVFTVSEGSNENDS